MQSSVTEPDSSQWGEDPFSLTNEAYARHLGLRVSRPSTNAATTSRRHREWENAEGLPLSQPTCTQSSATQPDSDEEDPFPTLPPPPAPPSTAETISHKGAGGSQAQSETESETENEDEDCGNGDDVDGATSMPDITSPDDIFDFRLLSPREVRRVVESGMRFRRLGQSSFVLRSSSRGEEGQDEDEGEGGVRGESEGEEEGESMPNTVR
ncbi:uncharacterized protein FOMMEDRAFT_21303, partial [Fomitiporia mediterranea MF3/22]|uniref:uncharacterized protein n=1 Tax=Fomitiporia mediterranea (strain MF3/22) TaxID=694068 RepID=UPI0004409361